MKNHGSWHGSDQAERAGDCRPNGLVRLLDRAGAAIAMGIFATGVAVSVLLIASHDRPFSGEISVKPDVLLQVRPE